MSESRILNGFPESIVVRKDQSGSALIVSLIMLLLLSLIGVAGMQSTTLQDRMTGNLQDQELAFQAAEAAVREAEDFLRNNPPANFPNNDGLYRVNADNRPDWMDDIEDNGNGIIEYGEDIDRTSSRPVYYIEQIDSIVPPGTDLSTFTEPVYYRVTALGYGGSEDAVAVITTVFKNK
ncbi:PilX N-terminal domain-containing pilus assembly protein [Marinobacter sp. M1N3S26]|uniref:pilus assembly PilX family protein n=1 Tax=unclassified Marinobacter TaxID=83889 RepID=UPI00387AEE2C